MRIKRNARQTIALAVTFLFLIIPPPPSIAGDSNDNSEWEIHLAPYFWLAGMQGTVSTRAGLPNADIDLDFFDDIFDDLDGSLMLVVEAKKGSWGIFTDFEYVDLVSEDSSPAGRLYSSIEVETESLLFTAAGFYRVIERNSSFVDIMAGLRYWSVETDITLTGALLADRSLSNNEDWTDPFFGTKFKTPLGQSEFYCSGYMLIGGLGISSDYFADFNVNLGYHWSKSFSTTLGFRVLDVKYDEEDFLYDVTQAGPILSLSWRL